jgi:WD40 repeat protein
MIKHTTIITFSLIVLVGLSSKRSLLTGGEEPVRSSTAWTASWSNNDSFIAIGNDNGELSIYETETWTKVNSWNFQATTLTKVKWNPKYPVLAIAAFSHEKKPSIIQLYDAGKNRIISNLPDTVFGRAVTWSPDGEEVAYVGAGGRISIYSRQGNHRKTLSFGNPRSLFDLDWHPSKNILLAVEDSIYLIDIDHDSLLARHDDGSTNKGILSCSWHPSGEFFVTGDYGHEEEGSEPSYLKYWNMKGVMLNRIKESRSEYRNVKWDKNGNYLAAATDVLLVLNKKGEVISKTKLGDHNLWGIDWNSKGDKIVSSEGAGNITVTDLNGKVLKAFALK